MTEEKKSDIRFIVKVVIVVLVVAALSFTSTQIVDYMVNKEIRTEDGNSVDVTTKNNVDYVDNNLLTVDITIPADFYSAENPATDVLSEKDKANGFISAKINADGSVTYKIKKSDWKVLVEQMKAEIVKSLNDIVTSGDYPSVKKVTYKNDFSEITLFVDKNLYNNNLDSFALLQVTFTVAFYRVYNQSSPEFSIIVRDIASNEIINQTNY